jgi:hypothetical protein
MFRGGREGRGQRQALWAVLWVGGVRQGSAVRQAGPGGMLASH